MPNGIISRAFSSALIIAAVFLLLFVNCDKRRAMDTEDILAEQREQLL